MSGIKIGMANLFIQHTSASLTINENADPDVVCFFVIQCISFARHMI